jgi:hypothetical protein
MMLINIYTKKIEILIINVGISVILINYTALDVKIEDILLNFV